MKQSKRKKENLLKKFSHEFRVSEPSLSDTYKIEFRGTADVIIEGCLGIVEYRDECIALNLGKRTVSFLGANLVLDSFLDGFVRISGTIMSAEFSS